MIYITPEKLLTIEHITTQITEYSTHIITDHAEKKLQIKKKKYSTKTN